MNLRSFLLTIFVGILLAFSAHSSDPQLYQRKNASTLVDWLAHALIAHRASLSDDIIAARGLSSFRINSGFSIPATASEEQLFCAREP